MDNVKKCPNCNAGNPQAANYCRTCRYEFPESSKIGLSLIPKINYFRIRESQYVIGSTIHIDWDADNFNKLELAGEDVTLYKNVELVVENAVEISLVAYSDYGQCREIIKIIPVSLSIIRHFSSTHNNLKAGKSAKLLWKVDYAKKILLRFDEREIDVTTLNELDVTPTKNTIYTLIAFSVDENISVAKQVTINVLQEVAIDVFSSNVCRTIESQSIILNWQVQNADKIWLLPNDLDVTLHSSVELYPNRSITYRLVASNAISICEKMLSISVSPLPRFDVKVSNSLSRLQIPACGIDLSSLTNSMREIDLTKWMLSPIEQHPISRKIWIRSLWRRLNDFLQ